MFVALLASAALADTLTLDSGAVIEGDLARYQLGGDCQITVTEGELTGVIVIVPCHRVQSFVRTMVRPPAPIGVPAEPSGVAEPEPALAVELPAPVAPAPLTEPSYADLADEPLIPVFETSVVSGDEEPAPIDEDPAPTYADPAPPARASLPVSGPAEPAAEEPAPGQPRSAPVMGEMPAPTRPIRF